MPSEEITFRASLDKQLEGIATDVKETMLQAKKTNGRVNKLELRMSIAFTAIIVILLLKFPDLIGVLKLVGL